MGSYLSRRRPAPPAPALPGGDLRPGPDGPRPARPARAVPAACRAHSADPAGGPAGRLSGEDRAASPGGRRRHSRCRCRCRCRRRFVTVYRKRRPMNRPFQGLFLGVVPSALQSGHPKKLVLSACGSKMFWTSAILKMAPARKKWTFRWALKHPVFCMWSALCGHLSSPCVKQTLMSASGESSKGKTQEEANLKALGQIPKEPVKLEEDPAVTPRRGSSGSGCVPSAFRPLIVNGVFSSFVPRPGPLKRDHSSNNSEDDLIEISQASWTSSCSKRNAITSSYSSTQGFPVLQGSGPGTSSVSGPGVFHAQAPAKKVGKEGHQSTSSASTTPESKIQGEDTLDTTSGQKQRRGDGSPTPTEDSSRPRKRKIPLLLPRRRGDPLIMPQAPQLGYQITTEDYDLEKKTSIQWINKFLNDDGVKIQSN